MLKFATAFDGANVLSRNGPAETPVVLYTWFPNALIENVYEDPLVRLSITIFVDKENPGAIFPDISV